MDLLLLLAVIVCAVICVASLIVSVHALRRPPTPTIQRAISGTPGGCRKDQHQWSEEPSLISDATHVFPCVRGCGSALRHLKGS